jgi:hypothetical protein
LIWYSNEDLEEPPGGGVGLGRRWLLSDVDTFFHPATQEVLFMVTGGYAEAEVRHNEEETPHRWKEHGGPPAGESRCGGGKSIPRLIGVSIF